MKTKRPITSALPISPKTRLLDLKQLVAAGYGSKSDIYQKVADGKFPKPIHIEGRTVWRESTLQAWLDSLEVKAKAG